MINPKERRNNRYEVRETQEKISGCASSPPMIREPSFIGHTEESRKELVNSTRRREIVEHSLTHLPWGADSETRIRALKRARQAVLDCGSTANELDLLKAATEAVEEVVLEFRRRERKDKWVSCAAQFLPFGSTEDDKTHAREAAITVLDYLPIDTPGYELERCIRVSLKDLIVEIKLREHKKDLVSNGVVHIDSVLSGLLLEDLISFDERWNSRLRRNLEAAVRRELKEGLAGDETADDVRAIVESTVEDALEIESTFGDDEDDGEADKD